MKQIRKAFIRLAYENPEIRPHVLPIVRSAAWEKLPQGWTQESIESFWSTLTGEAKHKVTKCIKRMEGKFDDPAAFCASVADKVDPGWRSRRAAVRKDLKAPPGKLVLDTSLGPNPDMEGSWLSEVPFEKRSVVVRDLKEARDVYRREYVEPGYGGSNVRGGRVYDERGKPVAYISWNGRVWEVDDKGKQLQTQIKLSSKQAAAYDDLGTPFRFKVIPGRLGVVYSIEIDGSHYRIAPEREHWRLDRLGMMGRIWEAVTPVEYDFPEEAAQDLHQRYKARKLSSKQASSSEATLRKLLSKKVFEVRDGDQTWTESGWDVAKVNMEDEEVVEFLLTAKKGAAFGGGHSLELRRIK